MYKLIIVRSEKDNNTIIRAELNHREIELINYGIGSGNNLVINFKVPKSLRYKDFKIKYGEGSALLSKYSTSHKNIPEDERIIETIFKSNYKLIISKGNYIIQEIITSKDDVIKEF